MHEHIAPNQHNPTQKFHKNLKNTKPRSKMHEKGFDLVLTELLLCDNPALGALFKSK